MTKITQKTKTSKGCCLIQMSPSSGIK